MINKKLPVGIDSFAKLRREDFYYVDKTGFIVDLLANWGEVNLFTRPRRFGKTLNMSMLKCFFEIGGDKSIFDGLAVSKEKALCDTYMGKYPVVFITLKGVDGLTFEDAYEHLRKIIYEEASRLQFLVDSPRISETDKEPLRVLLERRDARADIAGSLKLLCTLLEKHYGQKPILLIDEYDVPLDKAYAHGYYDQMIDLIRSMFGAALKTNESLFFAVLTGCLRVSKESIFTGLNNLKVYSITDLQCDEYFGFTDAEVRKMLADYDLEAHYEDTRAWYDGYRFGNQDVYCPWDVINYCDVLRDDPEAEPKAYWINTSGNELVRRLINKCADTTAQMDVERLIAGETVSRQLNENLTHNEIDQSIDNVWSLLYMTGYLTVTKRPSGGWYDLRIPNREIRQIYQQQVLSWFKDKTKTETNALTDLYTAFETGDAQAITEILNDQLLYTISYYDAYESFYHGFLLALLSTCADWQVASNVETGRGRCDILVQRRDRKLGFVVEVRQVRDPDQLNAACEAAMRQIEEKDYTAVLRRYRVKQILKYGIAFCDKESAVRTGSARCQ